ncbi:MAG: DUF2975 domain-containing protein [Candidatus Acidiferrales bacterium]
MRPENEARMRKIKRASSIARAICDALLALVALIGVGVVVDEVSGIGGINFVSSLFRTAGMGTGHRLILGVIAAATWGILFKGLYHLRRLFDDFARGKVFTRHAVAQLRWFGIACMLWPVMNFVWLFSIAASSQPWRTVAVPGNADAFGSGIVIIVIAWFMGMAVDLREENELTI